MNRKKGARLKRSRCEVDARASNHAVHGQSASVMHVAQDLHPLESETCRTDMTLYTYK